MFEGKDHAHLVFIDTFGYAWFVCTREQPDFPFLGETMAEYRIQNMIPAIWELDLPVGALN